MDEDEQIDKTIITFGSIIAISDFVDQTAFLFSDGFLKPQVFFKNFVHKELKKKTFDGLDNDSFYKCLFQILPRVSDPVKTHVQQDYNVTVIKKEEKDGRQKKMINKRMNEELNQLMNEYKQNIDAQINPDLKNQHIINHFNYYILLVLSYQHVMILNHQQRTKTTSLNQMIFQVNTLYLAQYLHICIKGMENKMQMLVKLCNYQGLPISNRCAYINCSLMEISEIKGYASIRFEYIQKKGINVRPNSNLHKYGN